VHAASGAVKWKVSTGAAWPEEATADPTGRFVALALNDGTLLVLDAKDGHALTPPLRANHGQVTNVSISLDGARPCRCARRHVALGEPPRGAVVACLSVSN
jgi:hypothetical protein